jgi:DNA-binding transcriptional LysR family regulator
MASRAGFDVRAALCFVAVAEEASFTRAAERLGMTQPSVSEMIRRLEHRLGFALFVRPSRQVQLTATGQAFLVSARKLARAHEEAQDFAQALARGIKERLRIGAAYASASIPERSALLAAYMQSQPQVSVEVVHGLKADLLRKLRGGETDFAVVVRPFAEHGLEWLTLHHGVGHFLVPIEDPLSKKSGVRVADLAGRSVVMPPREQDPEYAASQFDPLGACGAVLVTAPESIDQAMESFARLRRMIHLRFGLGRGKRRVLGDMVRLPVIDRSIDLEYALVRRAETPAPATQALWALAQKQSKAQLKGGQTP